MSVLDKLTLAAAGSVGNNTHTSVPVRSAGVSGSPVAFQFVVEAAGATPTITFKFQGSLDGVNWYDIPYVTDASGAEAVAGRTVTAVGTYVNFLSNPATRGFAFYRCVTSANTNITYRAEVYPVA